MSSSCTTSTSTSHTPDTTIIPIQLHPNSCTETCASPVDRDHEESQEVSSQDVEETNSLAHADRVQDQFRTVTRPVGRSVDWSVAVDNQLAYEDVMQISGAGHWFLEGWIGDHAVDFLVDSGSAVTAVSFFTKLWWRLGRRWVTYELRLGSCVVLRGLIPRTPDRVPYSGM